MNRFIPLAVLSAVLSFPVAVHTAALYIDSDVRIMVRQDVFGPEDDEAEDWTFVKSGDAFIFTDAELGQLREAARNGPYVLSEKETVYSSGLSTRVLSVHDAPYLKGRPSRDVVFTIKFDNHKGKEKVYIADKNFTLVDDQNNEYPIIPCTNNKWLKYKPYSPFIAPEVTEKIAICAEINVEVKMQRNLLKLRFDDGGGEEKWMYLK